MIKGEKKSTIFFKFIDRKSDRQRETKKRVDEKMRVKAKKSKGKCLKRKKVRKIRPSGGGSSSKCKLY